MSTYIDANHWAVEGVEVCSSSAAMGKQHHEKQNIVDKVGDVLTTQKALSTRTTSVGRIDQF